MNSDIAIVVVAYNRPECLKRLLKSLDRAIYSESVKLHISVDKANQDSRDNEKVVNVCHKFSWKYGEKIVDVKSENLGLKNHVLYCGGLTSKYNNIIVLEDDLLVCENFFTYAKKAIEHYAECEEISGISLYSQVFNEDAYRKFIPLKSEYDNYFMQLPSSWGQVWTLNQWFSFYEWYKKNNNINITDTRLPYTISRWSEKSWKKYFTIYNIECNKFFVYPYSSRSTNFSSVGTHMEKTNIANTIFQSSLVYGNSQEIKFANIESSHTIYDAFCENIRLKKFLGLDEEVESDYYGRKGMYNSRYLLSSNILNFKILNCFGLELKPYENNIIYDVDGTDLFLYDTSTIITNSKTKRRGLRWIFYDYTSIRILLKSIISIKTLRKLDDLRRFIKQ